MGIALVRSPLLDIGCYRAMIHPCRGLATLCHTMQMPADPNLLRLVTGPNEAGRRLDRVVADWRGLSRMAVRRLLDAQGVRLNGRLVKPKDRGLLVQAGDTLLLEPGFASGEAPLADGSVSLDVLAQGEGWVAVNKPAGVAVRPHRLDELGTVLNAVVAGFPGVVGVGEGGLRSGVLHRLDHETSGALLVGLTDAGWSRLRDAFAEHRITKRYLALLHGRPPEEGASKLNLRVARHSPSFVEVVADDQNRNEARLCSLAWRVVERFADSALVEVDLHTGFLHQVRVMMSYQGWPVLGDRVYGLPTAASDAPRQMLHAASLTFEEVVVQAPVPDDFQQQIQRLRRESPMG